MSDAHKGEVIRAPSAGRLHVGLYQRELWHEFAFAAIFAVVGLLMAIDPALAGSSPTLDVMPDFGVRVWGFSFLLGGLMTCVGLAKVRRDLEAGGCMLFAVASLTAFLAAVLEATSVSLLGIGFGLGGFVAGFGRTLWIGMRGC